MKRLGMWLLLGVIVLVVMAALFEPTQTIPGRLFGDAFFQSRPTRYWARALCAGPARQAESRGKLEQGGKDGVAVLVDILQDYQQPQDAELRCAAIEILAKLGPDATSAGPTLVETLPDSDPHVQKVCITALSKVGVSPQIAVPALTKLLKTDHNIVAARAISEYRSAAAPALNDLVELLQDKSQSVEARWNAARTIGKIGPEAITAVGPLIEATHDEESTIREHAAEALGDIGPSVGPEAIAALIQCLSDSNTRVRRDAVRSLGYIGPKAKEALLGIKKLLDDPEQIVRAAAGNALKLVAPDEPQPPPDTERDTKSSK